MDPVKRNRQYLLGLIDGLAQPIAKEAAQAVHATVRSLPPGALVTQEAIASLGLAPGVEAALVFQLLAQRYPEEVKGAVYSAQTLSGVLLAVLGGASDADRQRVSSAPPAFVAQFLDRLLTTQPEAEGSGVNLGARQARFEGYDAQAGTVSLLLDRAEGGPLRLTLDRGPAGYIQYRAGKSKPRPLSELDIPTLGLLAGTLHAHTAGGAKDPLLGLLRRSAEEQGAGVLKDLADGVSGAFKEKEQARLKELDRVAGTLALGLEAYAVGPMDKADLDTLAEKIFGAPGRARGKD